MPPNRHITKKQHAESARAAIKCTKSFLDAQGLKYSNRQLFKHFGVPEATGRRILQEQTRAPQGNEYVNENRGRKRILSEEDIQKIENFLYYGGCEGRRLPWEALPGAAGVDYQGTSRTTQKTIQHKDWRKCTECAKGWISADHAQRRVEAAKEAQLHRPRPEDWENIRFSDETHFSFGQEGRPKVTRPPGEKPCPDCIQNQAQPEPDNKYRCHAWAAVGYDFKSDLVWYDTASDATGAISMRTYVDKILDPIVHPWIERGEDFVLEEHRSIGHGTANKNNIVQQWKRRNAVESYVNITASPDLSPMEDAWKAPKAYIREHAIWDEEGLRETAEDGWEAVTQGTINSWVHSMPQRMQDVLDANGQLTAW
ncbi:hypothetical protein BX600DRAFT_519508 [Xylariales sp. PMI_506]|nr:hypothetical protein BX600DRAFT_519508 [Xylariales sp. PMI_506]